MSWTREAVIEAIRAHHRRYGRPPSVADWRRSGLDYPHPWPGRVAVLFGSWNAAIAAAGFTPRTANRDKRSGPRRQLTGGGREQGVTVSFADDREREWVTVSAPGPPLAALSRILALVPPRLSVRAISTPNTIYADLTRDRTAARAMLYPEIRYLGRVGHPGRLHPVLWSKTGHGEERDRYQRERERELREWRPAA